MAQQQKVLLYVLPLIFAFSGVNFPIGVLIYWTTTNLWSMGQQFYTIRRMPAPGSQAEAAMKARKAKKGKGGVLIEEAPAVPEIEEKPRGQREQPKRKDRNKPRVIEDATGSTSKSASSPTKPGTPAKPRTPTKPGTPAKPGSGKPSTPTKPSSKARGTGKPTTPADGGSDGPTTPTPGAPTKPKK